MKRTLIILLALAGTAHAQESAEAPHQTQEAAEDPTKTFNFTNFGYRGKDEYGGAFGDGQMVDDKGNVVRDEEGKPEEEEPMSPPFILALVNFGIFLLILAKYLAPAGRKVAEERHDQIKTALDEAAKLREQAQQKLNEYEKRIAGVDAEIEKLVAGIRADAEADKKRILEAAETQAAQMKRDAEQRIAAEIEQARAQLTEEVAAAAAAAAGKIVRERATADDQKRMVSTFIAGLGGR
jgi:F-type H+-transporting ATPase subunit b